MKDRSLCLLWLAAILLGLTSCSSISPMVANPSRGTDTPVPATAKDLEPVLAFPGAEGFGSKTVGGRAGAVIEVTNLNDSGPGSLRSAIESHGPRIVVFRVSGTIGLDSPLVIKNPYITIAGQTAPGEGITLRATNANTDPLLDITTHDVVVRYLALRAGPPAAGDAMNVTAIDHEAYNIVLDHNSLSWGVDQVFATWYDVHDISIQWNIFSEALDCSLHAKGCHSKGPMLGSYASDENKDQPGAYNLSFHHNLMAHNGERNPLVKTSGVCDVVNNMVYNPFGTFIHVDMERQLTVLPVNIVGNYFKPGPDTEAGKYGVRGIYPGSFGAQIYVEGNIGPHRLDDGLPEIEIVNPDSRQYVVSAPHPASPITTTTASQAYEQVLSRAGANMGLDCKGNFFARRDAIDSRIVDDVKYGTGNVIDDPSEVGGWLTIDSAVPCTDTDHDGMPDLWEQKYGFSAKDPEDASEDANQDGYTNIEEFLNGTNPIQ
jgi:pectate lyase